MSLSFLAQARKTCDAPAKVKTSTLYTEGGLSVYRHSPKTQGGNEYSGWPTPGLKEEVTIGDWIAEVEYVEASD